MSICGLLYLALYMNLRVWDDIFGEWVLGSEKKKAEFIEIIKNPSELFFYLAIIFVRIMTSGYSLYGNF